ncbi:MAG: ribosome maturation factor RimM [gamma proteobacterium endosymbiont of Trioza apicalis]
MLFLIKKPLIIGKICSPHGILGWQKVISFTQKIENLFKYQPWYIKKKLKYKILKLERWKYFNKNLIIKLKNINNRNIAKLFTNCKIIINYSQLPKLNDGNYYWKDIIGCKIININNYKIGKIIEIIETVCNNVLVVINLKKKYFIPFIYNKIIKNIDLINNIIKVDWNIDF